MRRRLRPPHVLAFALVLPLLVVQPAGAGPADPPGDAAGRPQAGGTETPTKRQIRKFRLTQRDLRRIAKSQDWAATRRSRAARRCLSGNDFRLVSARGSGAFQLRRKQWRNLQGRRFGSDAADAPGFAQKLVAWKLFRKTGWKRLGCPTADWMGVVFAEAPRTPLGRILVPGTHDSAAHGIRVTPPCSDTVIAGLPAFIGQAAKAEPCAVSALSRAQDLGLGAQLRRGVRYLDMRVGVPADRIITAPRPPAKNPLAVPLVLHHSVVSQPLLQGLKEVLKFTRAHPTEQIILDFQHIDLLDPAVPANRAINAYYYDAVDRILHDYRPVGRSVCSAAWTKAKVGVADRDLARVPVRRGWRVGRNLVVLMESELPADDCFRSREQAILSLWPNTEEPAQSKADNDRWLAERKRRLAGPRSECIDASGRNWCGLFVNQLQLSLQTGTQVDCIVNDGGPLCSLLAASQLVNDRVAGYMTRWTDDDMPTNIEIVDFFERSSPSIVDRLIRLNWQRTGQLGGTR